MKYFYFFYAVVFGFSQKVDSQINNAKTIISKVYYRGDTLHVQFENRGRKPTIVPILSYRTGNDRVNMYEGYYNLSNDTLYIKLSSEINSDLIKIQTSHHLDSISGKLFYADKKLKGHASYWTFARFSEIKNPKILVLRYENETWTCPVK